MAFRGTIAVLAAENLLEHLRQLEIPTHPKCCYNLAIGPYQGPFDDGTFFALFSSSSEEVFVATNSHHNKLFIMYR